MDKFGELVDMLQNYAKRFFHDEAFVTEADENLGSLHEQLYKDDVENAFNIHRMTSNDHAASNQRRDAIKAQIERNINLQQMAFRDAAMTLYHFNDVLKGISKELARSALQVDTAHDFQHVFEKFCAGFPNVVKVRNSIGHEGQNLSDDASRAGHEVTGPQNDGVLFSFEGGALFAYGNIQGRTFSSTYAKELVSFELSKITVSTLERITQEARQILLP